MLRVREAILKSGTDLQRAERFGIKYPWTEARLRVLTEMIETKALDDEDLLPRGVSVPFNTVAASAQKLQERLNAVTTELSIIQLVLRNGIYPTVQVWDSGAKRAEAQEALGALDALGGNRELEQAAVEAEIPTLLSHYLETQADLIPLTPSKIEEADYVIRYASQLAWWIWASTSVLSGLLIVIVPNAGFGWIDLLYCVLWGLGLLAAGAAFQAFTPASVATTIGLAIPKPS